MLLSLDGTLPSTDPDPEPEMSEDYYYCFSASYKTFAALGKSTNAVSLLTNWGITLRTSST